MKIVGRFCYKKLTTGGYQGKYYITMCDNGIDITLHVRQLVLVNIRHDSLSNYNVIKAFKNVRLLERTYFTTEDHLYIMLKGIQQVRDKNHEVKT